MDAHNAPFVVRAMNPRPRAPLLQACLDDSGGDPISPIYVLAGYFATEENMRVFSQKWADKKDGPPWLEYWHTSTARGGYGGRFRPEDIERIELSLAGVVAEMGDRVVSMSIEMDKELYRRVVVEPSAIIPPADKLRLPPSVAAILSSPFYVLFHHAMVSSYIIADRMGSMEGSQLLMEDAEGAEWQDQVCLASRAYRRFAPLKYVKAIASVTFVPGKGRVNVPGIEAADLLAWHIRRKATYPNEPDASWPARAVLEGQSKKGNRVVVTEDQLLRFIRDVNAVQRHQP